MLHRSVQFFSCLFTIWLNKIFHIFSGSEQDYIKIAGVTVPFLVKGSKVYFDLLAAFALMGQLQLAMKNDWKEIDAMLHEQGFDLRVAFRINISGKKKYDIIEQLELRIWFILNEIVQGKSDCLCN